MIRKCADVSRYGDGFRRHVWIAIDGINIDISADQFPDIHEKVIVTRHSRWHDELEVIEEKPYALDGDQDALYDRYRELECYEVYGRILADYA